MPASGRPSSVIAPSRWRSTPKMACITCCCPWPSRPPSPTISPGRTSRSTPSSAGSQRRARQERSGASDGSGGATRGGNSSLSGWPIISPIMASRLRAPAGKVSMCRPFRNTEIRSATASISYMRCEMNRTPHPELRSRRMTSNTFSARSAVSAEVASSRMRRRGLRWIALAISTSCRSARGRSEISADETDMVAADAVQRVARRRGGLPGR